MKYIEYVEKRTLANRGPVDPLPDEEVEGELLMSETPALEWESGHIRTGHNACSLYPAYSNGVRSWVLRKDWCAATGYCASGTIEFVIPFSEGIEILVKHGRFSFPIPNEPSEDERVRDGVAEHRHGGYGYFHAKDRVHL